MCGRFGLISSPEAVADTFDIKGIAPFPERYNIAPSQPVLMIMNASDSVGGGEGRTALLVRWGLIPAWLKDATDFPLLFNARSETVAQKNAFRGSLRHFRALVPASGFYEWRKGKAGSQAYWIRPRDGGLIAFAALVSPWMGADGTELDTGTILTTRSSGVLTSIHQRAPVIIAKPDFERWLDCVTLEPRHVDDLLKPAPDDFFEAVPVSNAVNNAQNMGSAILRPVGPVLRSDAERPPEGKAQLDLF